MSYISSLALSLPMVVIGCNLLAVYASCTETDATTEKSTEPAASITWRGFSGDIVCDGVWHDDVVQAKYFLNDQLLGDGEEGYVALLAKLSDLPVGSRVLVAPTDEWIQWRGQESDPFNPILKPSTFGAGPSVVPFLMNVSYFRRFKEVVDDRRLRLQWDCCDRSGRKTDFDQDPRDVFEQRSPVSKDEENACKEWLTRIGEGDQYDSHILVLVGDDIHDEDLKHLRAMPCLIKLAMLRTPVTDGGMRHLSSLTRLSILELLETDISDEGLREISRLHSLRRLKLIKTKVTDAGMAYLSHLPHLRDLSLRETQVGDIGVSHLEQMNLMGLELAGTLVTDAGLESLKKMSVLRYLDLKDTAVTEGGVLELQKSEALPLCDVQSLVGFERLIREMTIEPE